MSYSAIVTSIEVSPHPNADRLQIGYAMETRVIVGLETQSGELGILFPYDGQLSKEFCDANDLLPRYDENGVKIGGGYFDANRRVRAQNFRQVKSEGFWVPLSYLSFTGYDISKLKQGDMFTELAGIPICNKYYSAATLRAINNANKNGVKVKEVVGFPEHWDTPQFRFVQVPDNSIVYISEKLHGTSARYGRVPVLQKLQWWKRAINKIAPVFPEYEHEFVVGSRRVVLATDSEGQIKGGYYGDGSPYSTHAHLFRDNLNKDEVIYGEIVGYLHTGSPLFSQTTKELKDIKKLYGEKMDFSYGNPTEQSSFYVYRITQSGVELSWSQVCARAKQLGLRVVPNLSVEVFDGNRDRLNAKVESMLEGPSTLDTKHIREGVCLRIESEFGITIVKAKSYSFKVCEGIIKSDDNYVDMEEIA